MLVLTRQLGEEIIIDGNIRVGIVKIARNKVQLSIQTPEGIRILRQELLLRELASTQPKSVAVSQ